MSTTQEFMTDREVCDLLRISRQTLRRHLQEGPPTKQMPSTFDIRLVERTTIGGQRRWSRASLMEMINGN